MTSLTRWVLAHRRLVVSVWIILTLAGAVAAGPASRALSQEYSVPGHEGWQTNQAITRTFHTGGNSAPLVAVVTLPPGASMSSVPVRKGLVRLSERIQSTLPGARVASYTSTDSPAFVSSDGRATFVLVYPPPQAHSFGQSPKAARALRIALAGTTVAAAPVHLTGLDALQNETGHGDGPGVFAEAVIGGLGALLVLAFVFASLQALLPIVIAVVSIMTCFLAVLVLTAITEVSALVEFVIALVGLGVAIDYSLLVVARWREERAAGHREDDAIVRAMQTAGRAVVFSGTTVGIGLLALIAVPLPFLRSVGFGGMLIPIVSVLAAITLLPIMLARWGERLDWPHHHRPDGARSRWARLAEAVVRRRLPAAAIAMAVLLALAWAATSLQFGDSAGNPDEITHHGDARTGLAALERSGIGFGVLTPIEILSTPATASRLASGLSQVPGVHGAAAPHGWRHDGRAIVDVFSTATDSTAAGRAALQQVRAAAHRFASTMRPRVGGIMAQNQDFVSAVYGSFPLMIALIAVVTFVLLARALRSLLLPLKAIALNVVSVAAAWGVLTLVWQKGYGSNAIWGINATGSVPSWMPIMIFAFLFGLSTDYEVFILSRMREEYDQTGSTSSAVVNGIGRTGRLVTSAALILFLAFVAMGSGPQTTLKMLATGLAAGILIDATVIRSVLVPALVSLFGRWNWWLPRRAAELLRVAPSPLQPIRVTHDATDAGGAQTPRAGRCGRALDEHGRAALRGGIRPGTSDGPRS